MTKIKLKKKPPGPARARAPKAATAAAKANGPCPRWIWHLQIRAGWTDAALASAIGVSRRVWVDIRSRAYDPPSTPGWSGRALKWLAGAQCRRDAVARFLAERNLGSDPAALFDCAPSAPSAEALALKRSAARRDSVRLTHPHDDIVINWSVESMLTKTIRHFKLSGDPFAEDITKEDDIYLTAAWEEILDNLHQVARQGGFRALVGESGSGKSVMRKLFEARLADGGVVSVIRPQTLDQRKITTTSLLYSILADLGERPVFTHEEKMVRQARQLLIARLDSHKRNVLLIEDAQRLNKDTLYFLKGLVELSHNFKPLVGVALFAQPELEGLLNEEVNYDLRQTSRRVEILRMPALNGESRDYLAHKFSRVGAELDKVLAADGLARVMDELTTREKQGFKEVRVSRAYPLLLQNVITKAMNFAAGNGFRHVTADAVTGALRPARW